MDKTRWAETGAPAHRRVIRFPREALGSASETGQAAIGRKLSAGWSATPCLAAFGPDARHEVGDAEMDAGKRIDFGNRLGSVVPDDVAHAAGGGEVVPFDNRRHHDGTALHEESAGDRPRCAAAAQSAASGSPVRKASR